MKEFVHFFSLVERKLGASKWRIGMTRVCLGVISLFRKLLIGIRALLDDEVERGTVANLVVLLHPSWRVFHLTYFSYKLLFSPPIQQAIQV